MIFQCSSSCRYPANCSTPLLLLVVLISPYPFTMSACIQLHLLMLRFWAFLIINLSILTHPLVMMVLQWFALSHIGMVHFFFCSLLTYCDYTLNHSYAWLMTTSNRSLPHSMNWQPLLLMMFWVYHFNNLDDIFILFSPFWFLNYCAPGNMVIHHLIFSFILEELPWLLLGIFLFAMIFKLPFCDFLDMSVVLHPFLIIHTDHVLPDLEATPNQVLDLALAHASVFQFLSHQFHPPLPQFHLSRICLQWSHLTRHWLLSQWHRHHYLQYPKILKYRILPCL